MIPQDIGLPAINLQAVKDVSDIKVYRVYCFMLSQSKGD
jgi:hypothetical protein